MLLVSYTCYSQVKVGFKAGVNTSTIVYAEEGLGWSESTDDEKLRIGYYFGASSKIALGEKFALQPEFLFSLKGERVTAVEGDFKTRAYYLNLPLLVSYNFLDKFFVVAGPEFGYLTDSYLVDPNGKKIERPDRFRTLDLGLTAGAGYEVLPALFVELRYIHGFNEVQQWRDSKFGRNRVFQLGLAYQFINNKK